MYGDVAVYVNVELVVVIKDDEYVKVDMLAMVGLFLAVNQVRDFQDDNHRVQRLDVKGLGKGEVNDCDADAKTPFKTCDVLVDVAGCLNPSRQSAFDNQVFDVHADPIVVLLVNGNVFAVVILFAILHTTSRD